MRDLSPGYEPVKKLREIRAKQKLRRSLGSRLAGPTNEQRQALTIEAWQITDHPVSQMFVGVAHFNIKRLLSRTGIAVLHPIRLCLRVVARAKPAVSVEQVNPGVCPRTPNKKNVVLFDLADA